MKRIACAILFMMAIPLVSGMNCQGTTTSQPACETNCGPPTPDSGIILKAVAADGAKDQLLLNGEFGPDQGSVMINGTTLNVVSWGPVGPIQQVICDLPREAFGNVQVQVGTQFSNIAQLTKWELTLVSKTRIPASAPSSGQHNIDITAKFIIRSCLNNLLNAPGNFGSFASVSRASTGDFDASGTINNPATPSVPPEHITLSRFDPQELRIIYPGDPTDPATERFSAGNFVCGASRGSGGGIKLLFSIAGYYKVTHQVGTDVTVGEHATGYATNSYFDTSQPVLFFFDGDFNIVGGSKPDKNNSNSTLEWQEAGARRRR